jgi:hypothetical protein
VSFPRATLGGPPGDDGHCPGAAVLGNDSLACGRCRWQPPAATTFRRNESETRKRFVEADRVGVPLWDDIAPPPFSHVTASLRRRSAECSAAEKIRGNLDAVEADATGEFRNSAQHALTALIVSAPGHNLRERRC